MNKNILVTITMLVNFIITYGITTLFNIKNIILFQSMTAMNYTLTYEVIIWYALTLLEYVIYKYILLKYKNL